MKFGHVEIFVKDPVRSRDFYESVLGFKVIDIQDELFVWLKSDEFHLLLRPGNPAESSAEYSSSNTGFVLYTDDLPGTVERLQANGLRFNGNDGSEKCPTFRDPDGNWFQLVNPNDH
ncbi:MAG: VOC family protein [Ignavibacteria bacterium]|nr:VOC family protein [Ignavibacteria bacterium]